MIRILIVDDERTARKGLFFTLRNQIDEIIEAESDEQAKKLLGSYDFDLAIVDLRLPTEDHGIGLIQYIRDNYSLIPVLVITAFGSVSSAVRAIKSGAQDYVTKDFSKEEIIIKIEKLIETRKLWMSNLRLSHEVKDLREKYSKAKKSIEIVGDSAEMKKILNMVSRISNDNDTTVLITGESGTGKELVARSIHYNSPDRKENEVYGNPVSNVDISPTIAYLFGIKEVGSFKGVSLLPLHEYPKKGCFGEAMNKRGHKEKETDRPIYYYLKNDLKVIFDEGTSLWEMFDLSKDPGELHNIIDTSPLAENMKNNLIDWIKTR